MRQTVVGLFMQQAGADAALRRLEMRGFEVECVGGSSTAPMRSEGVERSSGVADTWQRIRTTLRALAPFSQTPRPGEVHVKVRANSMLEAQAAREILRASGAQEAGCLGEGWTNWNW
jgi:hypothetical protein